MWLWLLGSISWACSPPQAPNPELVPVLPAAGEQGVPPDAKLYVGLRCVKAPEIHLTGGGQEQLAELREIGFVTGPTVTSPDSYALWEISPRAPLPSGRIELRISGQPCTNPVTPPPEVGRLSFVVDAGSAAPPAPASLTLTRVESLTHLSKECGFPRRDLDGAVSGPERVLLRHGEVLVRIGPQRSGTWQVADDRGDGCYQAASFGFGGLSVWSEPVCRPVIAPTSSQPGALDGCLPSSLAALLPLPLLRRRRARASGASV